MKTTRLLLLVCIAMITSSCATTFYQVYQTTPVTKMEKQSNSLAYEDENCKVVYDFWKDGGNVGFLFQNKTDEDIYVNLDESFFILNGISYKYFQNRIFTNTKNKTLGKSKSATKALAITGFNLYDLVQTNGVSVTDQSSAVTSTGYSVSFNEEDIVCIPGKTSKYISEFSINETLIRDCDLLRYPTNGNDVKIKRYSQDSSPVLFSNRIAYQIGREGETTKFENKFFVSSITNYNNNQMFELGKEEFCGQKSLEKTRFHKHYAPDRFFIEYTKSTDQFKH